jgi:peptidyl-prolyl cis-trans isomerase SurA
MKHITKIAIFTLLLSSFAVAEVLDRVVAVVDNEIILFSELEGQLQLLAVQGAVTIKSEADRDSLRNEILDKMIEDKVLLVQARRDTTIEVTNQEVDDALTRQIAGIKSQFPNEQAFQEQLRAEGLTLRELRDQYKDEVEKQLLKEKLLQNRLAQVKVSTGEVRQFYEDNLDSLPEKPAGVKLAHILISVNPGKETRDSLYNYASLIREKVLEGEDFSALAKNYSDDPSGAEGGELGWFGRNEMVPEFEKAAFSLQPGDISEIVETQFGYHIIRGLGRREDKVRVSHILISLIPTERDLKAKRELADTIYAKIQNGGDFGEMASEFSDDEGSKNEGGKLGWYAANDLIPEFLDIIGDLEIGGISAPVATDFGIHILKLEDKRPASPIDLEEDFKTMEEMARRDKTQKQIELWLEKVSSQIFIDKRL